MRQVLVTGASKGIGKACAIELAKKGFHIVIHYGKDEDGAQNTLEHIVKNGGSGYLISFDVRDTNDVKSKLDSYIQEHGAFYGLVINAGITRDCAFPMMSKDDWLDVIDTDLNGFYNVVNPCIMPMIALKQGGRIVSISSVSGICGNRGQVNYSAAKAGLIGATKALALELAKRRITVNCVAPGLIDTNMTKLPKEVLDIALDMIPMHKMGKVEDVAHAVSFLMSDEASYITREVLSVNGGLI